MRKLIVLLPILFNNFQLNDYTCHLPVTKQVSITHNPGNTNTRAVNDTRCSRYSKWPKCYKLFDLCCRQRRDSEGRCSGPWDCDEFTCEGKAE